MPFFRIVPETDLRQILMTGQVPRNREKWAMYDPGTVVCMFEANEFGTALTQHFKAIGALWGLEPSDSLYVLQFKELALTSIAIDQSARGWNNARVYLEKIPALKVWVVARLILAGTSPDFLQIGSIENYAPPKQIAEIIGD